MQLSEAELTIQIENFIRSHFDVPADDPYFDTEINLWEEGYVDSVGVVELIAFLETEFGVTIRESYLFSPDFTRVEGIARIIRELQGERDGELEAPQEPQGTPTEAGLREAV
jgi:acyl carrier protein